MRILPCSVLFCVFVVSPVALDAQDRKSPFDYDTPPFAGEADRKKTEGKISPRLQPRYALPAVTTARLIHERALRQARQRRARIEARAWAGQSLLRPNLKTLRPAGSDWWPDVPVGSWPVTEQYHLRWSY